MPVKVIIRERVRLEREREPLSSPGVSEAEPNKYPPKRGREKMEQ